MIKNRMGLYEKAMPNNLAFIEKLKLAKCSDYDYLELSIDETPEKLSRLDMSASQLNEWKRQSEQEGMPLGSMCLSGHRRYPLGSRDEETRTRGMEIMEKAIQMSAYLGIRVIQLAGYDVYYENGGADTEKYFIENLIKSVGIAGKYGVILAFETMETPFMNTIEKALRFVAQVNSPYLQIYPDIGNITNGSGNPIEDIRIGNGHIVAAHLKETLPNIFRDLQFGEGHVDFDSCIKELKTQSVGMFVTEFWYDGKSQPLEYLKIARKFFEGKL